MASRQPPDGQPTSFASAVGLHRLQGIGRTARFEPALSGRPEKRIFRRGDNPAIKSYCCHQNVLSQIHGSLLRTFNNPAFRSVVKKSFSTSPKLLPAIDGRATSTKSTCERKSCWCNRKHSRKSRRARLRVTAFPTFPPEITPRRESEPDGNCRQLATRQPRTTRSPSSRTRLKSRPCFIRA